MVLFDAETLALIFKFATTDDDEDNRRFHELTLFSLVSQSWRHEAQRLLFREFSFLKSRRDVKFWKRAAGMYSIRRLKITCRYDEVTGTCITYKDVSSLLDTIQDGSLKCLTIEIVASRNRSKTTDLYGWNSELFAHQTLRNLEELNLIGRKDTPTERHPEIAAFECYPSPKVQFQLTRLSFINNHVLSSCLFEVLSPAVKSLTSLRLLYDKQGEPSVHRIRVDQLMHSCSKSLKEMEYACLRDDVIDVSAVCLARMTKVTTFTDWSNWEEGAQSVRQGLLRGIPPETKRLVLPHTAQDHGMEIALETLTRLSIEDMPMTRNIKEILLHDSTFTYWQYSNHTKSVAIVIDPVSDVINGRKIQVTKKLMEIRGARIVNMKTGEVIDWSKMIPPMLMDIMRGQ